MVTQCFNNLPSKFFLGVLPPQGLRLPREPRRSRRGHRLRVRSTDRKREGSPHGRGFPEDSPPTPHSRPASAPGLQDTNCAAAAPAGAGPCAHQHCPAGSGSTPLVLSLEALPWIPAPLRKPFPQVGGGTGDRLRNV